MSLPDKTNSERPLKMGQALWELGREIGITDDDAATINGMRETSRHEPINFEE